MGGLLSRRRRARVDAKQVSTPPSQLPKDAETQLHAPTEPGTGDSLNTVLHYIGKRLRARRRHQSLENRKRSPAAQSRTSQQEEDQTCTSGSGKQQEEEQKELTATADSFRYTSGLEELMNEGFADAEIKGNAGRRGMSLEESPRGRSRSRVKPKSSSSKDRQHTFNFRAPKVIPSLEDVPSRDCNQQETSQDSTADAGEGFIPKERHLKVVRDDTPSLKGHRDEQLEVKDKTSSTARKDQCLIDELGSPSTIRHQWERSSTLPQHPSRTSTSRRHSRKKLTPTVKLTVYREPRSLEEELEMLTVEEILQSGFGSRFQGDVLEIGAMTATGSYIRYPGVNLRTHRSQVNELGQGNSVGEACTSKQAVHQTDNFAQPRECIWASHQSVDSLVPGYGDMGGKDAVEDIAEDTLDCNVDDRVSSPPVCCGCEMEWEDQNKVTTLELPREADLSVAPRYVDFQQSRSSDRNAPGTVDNTEALEAVTLTAEGMAMMDNRMSEDRHHASGRTTEARRQRMSPSLALHEQILPHCEKNPAGGEDSRSIWPKCELERKDQEAVAMLVLTGKMVDYDAPVCQHGGGDFLAVGKEGEDSREGMSGGDGKETTTCKSPCTPQEQPLLDSGNVLPGQLSTGARVRHVQQNQSTTPSRSIFGTSSDTCLLQTSISGSQLDSSSNRPAYSHECEDSELTDLAYVLQDHLLLQHLYSTGTTGPEGKGDSELLTATCAVAGTDLPVLSGGLDRSILGMKVSDSAVFNKSHVEQNIQSGDHLLQQDHMHQSILSGEQLSGQDTGSAYSTSVQLNEMTDFCEQTRHLDHGDTTLTSHGCSQVSSCSNESDTFHIQDRSSGIHSLHMMASKDL